MVTIFILNGVYGYTHSQWKNPCATIPDGRMARRLKALGAKKIGSFRARNIHFNDGFKSATEILKRAK